MTEVTIKTKKNLREEKEKFTRDEFIKFYKLNKEEVDKKPTRGLNIKYKIDGYKLKRQGGELTFIPCEEQEEEINDDSVIELKLDSLARKISILEKNITLILKLLQSDPNYQ